MDSVLGPIFDAIGWLLAQFYSVIPNLGVAIILMTIVVMLLLYPLTAKQAKSMIAMQRLQPEIKKLQAKYKGDRQKLNEETMKFYQENKINPLAGCLPLLVQMPILISLVSVLRNAYKYVPSSSSLHDALCHGFGKSCGIDATQKLLSKFGDTASGITKGNPLVHHLHFLGIDLQNAASGKHDGLLDALPYFLLVALVMITGFAQSRQAQRRTPAANKQMAAVMKVLPVMFGLFSIAFPSGVVLYFFVSSLIRLGQQEVIFRRFGSAVHGPGGKPLDVKSTERGGKAAPPPAEIEVADEPEMVEATRAPPPTARARPTPTPAGRATGLRGFLQLPPPPEGNGETAPAGTTTSSPRSETGQGKAAGSSGSRRRRGKKKRKR